MGRVIVAGMVKPRSNGVSVSRVIIGAAVFAFGLLAGAGIAMWVGPGRHTEILPMRCRIGAAIP
jgi:hypothetical protein